MLIKGRSSTSSSSSWMFSTSTCSSPTSWAVSSSSSSKMFLAFLQILLCSFKESWTEKYWWHTLQFCHRPCLAGMGSRHHRAHGSCTLALARQAWFPFPSPIVGKHPGNWVPFGEHLAQGPAPRGQSLVWRMPKSGLRSVWGPIKCNEDDIVFHKENNHTHNVL